MSHFYCTDVKRSYDAGVPGWSDVPRYGNDRRTAYEQQGTKCCPRCSKNPCTERVCKHLQGPAPVCPLLCHIVSKLLHNRLVIALSLPVSLRMIGGGKVIFRTQCSAHEGKELGNRLILFVGYDVLQDGVRVRYSKYAAVAAAAVVYRSGMHLVIFMNWLVMTSMTANPHLVFFKGLNTSILTNAGGPAAIQSFINFWCLKSVSGSRLYSRRCRTVENTLLAVSAE